MHLTIPSTDRRLAALAFAALMAGCAAPSPAPVESRTGPAASARPAPPKPVQAPAAAATAPAPAPAVEVQAAPVRSSGLQVRPLETAPDRTGPAPRSGPVGVKQPYSE
ncbi:MAG TPA: hypothetical protein VN324_01120, partial [Quisquiliibacterium sp.]|nr:hypothetical protein [Quisquiliibacterium sp.]